MPYHAGELAVQRRAGVLERAAPLGDPGNEVPPVAADFLAAQPWIVVGHGDAAMWATPFFGPPGFISVPSETSVHVAGPALSGNVGAIALDPATRRRMRLNGFAYPDGDGFTIELDQVYSNCPKYIATRHVGAVVEVAPVAHRASALDSRAAVLLSAADTAFVATRAAGGADASHRGGNPGFLRVLDEHTVVWPDYQGNSMFNTLGNITVDPATGLTVIDPEHGTVLQLSGSAEVLPDRSVRLSVRHVVRTDEASPLRWVLDRPARNPPLGAPSRAGSAR
jgi:predicted pyridoxine 5'-phosphate oxidase superfamily flavin-nucleotide-binding protein